MTYQKTSFYVNIIFSSETKLHQKIATITSLFSEIFFMNPCEK